MPPRHFLAGDNAAYNPSRKIKGGRADPLNGVLIEDTFAEAFPMRATRLVITADEPHLGADRRRRR